MAPFCVLSAIVTAVDADAIIYLQGRGYPSRLVGEHRIDTSCYGGKKHIFIIRLQETRILSNEKT